MATLCTTDADVSILTPNYMTLLQSLCTITTPSVNDVTAIFKEFRRSLDARKSKHSSASTSSLSSSSGTSKKRSGRSAGRGGGDSDDAAGGGERGGGRSDVGFERSCTWEQDKKRCWIMSDLDLWNRILSRDCIELRENKWGELTLQGYEWPENNVEPRDMLCASLLIHLLLRQHRCVTSVFLDMSITTVERHVLWHVLKTGGVGIKCLTFKPFFLNLLGLMTSIETTMWSEAVSAMTNLKILHISSIYLCAEVARTLGGYVEHATALRTLLIVEVEAPDTDAAVFLDFLSRNRTVEVLCVELPFLIARHGQALADVVRNHVTLNRLEVTGTFDSTPSALLKAAVVSPALRSLKVQRCALRAEDVEAMASALTLHMPSRAREGECSADMAPPPPTSRLEELIFLQCAPCDSRLEEAYADLIGGVLLHLKVAKCSLGEPFAVAAAANLLLDKRLQKLDLEDNEFPVSALFSIIDVLEVNKTLKVLALNTPGTQPPEEVAVLFELIQEINVFSRLKFHCVRLRASHFAALVRASKAATIYQHLDEVGVEDAVEFLDALASARSVGLTWLECTTLADQLVVQKLIDTLARTKSLRKVPLIYYIGECSERATNLSFN
ncbi:uncharacterized protein [Dermacentor andersoni]|uniref:uncharacterized protein n=1 Tax=Dermacentor andersoni TaxID=34620 RepID=UPI002155EC15|nr:uncharacterized protein LOC126527839 [Dermacentor andersoni]